MAFFYLKRWWQHLGFGIESRTDYDFLHNVIREKLPYYFYDEMRNVFPQASRREHSCAQLLFRLGNAVRPSEVLFYGTPKEINRYALLHTVVDRPAASLIVFIEGEPPADVRKFFHAASMVIITDIHGVNESLWQQLLQHEHCISFDMRNIGIAMIDRKRFSQHYNI